MQLRSYQPHITNTYTQQYWYEFYNKKYSLQGVSENYFEYINGIEYFSLSMDEWQRLQEAVAAVNRVFLQAYKFYMQDFQRNLIQFSAFEHLFREEFPLAEYLIGRYDILIDQNNEFRFLETNANTPGMTFESHYPSSFLVPETHINTGDTLIDWLQNWVIDNAPAGKKLGIFTAYAFENEDYLTCRDIADIFSKNKSLSEMIVGDVFELHIVEGELYLRGEKIDAIYSYFPLEFFLTDPEFASEVFSIIASKKIPYANPLESMVLQDKLIFATVWENFSQYSKEDQGIIQKHIPFTTREFQEDSERFIAKWRFGRYGREIYTTDFYTNIYEQRKYVYQEKVQFRREDSKGSFIVLGAYTNYKNCLGVISRKQDDGTTDDTYNTVAQVFVESSNNTLSPNLPYNV